MTANITFQVGELPSEEEIQNLIETFTNNLRLRYGLAPDADGEETEYFGATTPEDEDSDESEEEEDLTSAQLVSEAVRVLKLAEGYHVFDPDAAAILAGIADRYIALADIVSGHDHYGF